MKVKLTYFKPSGKYYTDDSYITDSTAFWEAIAELRQLFASGHYPGLCGDWSGKVLVSFQGCDVPHLL